MLRHQPEADRAFEWLDKAADANELTVGMRQPNWFPFLRQVGMAPEQLAAIKLVRERPHHPRGALEPMLLDEVPQERALGSL